MIEQIKIVYDVTTEHYVSSNGAPINLLLPEPHQAVEEELINSYDFIDLNWFHYYATFDGNEEFRFEVHGSFLIGITNVEDPEIRIDEFYIPFDHPLAPRFMVMRSIHVQPEGAPVVNRRRLPELQCNLQSHATTFREAILAAQVEPPVDPNDAIVFDV
jgi:hypothetical protein